MPFRFGKKTMKTKFSAIFSVALFIIGVIGTVAAQPAKNPANTSNELLSRLPSSDMAMTIDTKRLLEVGLPQVLATNPVMLGDINAKLNEIREKTGIDLRQFDQVAVGLSAYLREDKTTEIEPMILAHAKYGAGALIEIAKLGGGGSFTENTIGGKKVYVFDAEKLVIEAKTKTGNTAVSGILDSALNGLNREMAVTSLDGNILAIGSVRQMRSMLEEKTTISVEVQALVNRKAGSIICFGGLVPSGLSKVIDIDDDLFGKRLDSIRKVSGFFDISRGTVSVWIAAETVDAAQAKDLRASLVDLQELGKILFSNSRGSDKRVYAKMIDGAKITQDGSEVALDIRIAQADIDVLVGQAK